ALHDALPLSPRPVTVAALRRSAFWPDPHPTPPARGSSSPPASSATQATPSRPAGQATSPAPGTRSPTGPPARGTPRPYATGSGRPAPPPAAPVQSCPGSL